MDVDQEVEQDHEVQEVEEEHEEQEVASATKVQEGSAQVASTPKAGIAKPEVVFVADVRGGRVKGRKEGFRSFGQSFGPKAAEAEGRELVAEAEGRELVQEAGRKMTIEEGLRKAKKGVL